MTGLFTLRRRLIDLAREHMRNADATPEETRMLISIGSDVLAVDLTRQEAEAMVRDEAIAALKALLERGSGYPQSLVVCSPVSVAVDSGGGVVTQIMATPGAGGMSVEIRINESAFLRAGIRLLGDE